MILNNVTMIVNGELVKRDIYFEKEIYYIKKELSRLFVHGLLHILGFDHRQESDYLEMERLAAEILT